VDATTTQARHAQLLQAQPLPPVRLIVYFLLDKAQLTEASKATLATVLAAVKQRKPTEVTIFGHADPSGSRERNLRLSAERAQAVADWLRAADPTLDAISVQYFGDRQPPGDADAGTDPARFRRAEIQIL
jgi:outer membrane protein OmpA-like peptidoglycan-associated protein